MLRAANRQAGPQVHSLTRRGCTAYTVGSSSGKGVALHQHPCEGHNRIIKSNRSNLTVQNRMKVSSSVCENTPDQTSCELQEGWREGRADGHVFEAKGGSCQDLPAVRGELPVW